MQEAPTQAAGAAPTPQEQAPEVFSVSPFVRRLSTFLMRLLGWRIEGSVHLPPRFVLIAAPHTSNWDGFFLVLGANSFGIRLRWFVKEAWCRGVMGPILRWTGAFPIDRTQARGVVGQVVDRFADGRPLIVTVAPEGTRRLVPHWKLGFYHIARGAGVPLVFGYVDYGTRRTGLGPAFMPTGDVDADFAVLREFYSRVTPRHRRLMGPIEPPPSGAARE